MKTTLKYIMIALFTMSIIACSPEDGKDGLNGMDGTNGTNGTNGEQGIPGEDGNPNVTSYLFEQQVFLTGVSDPYLIPAITQDILDYGVVIGYMKNHNSNLWFTLPYINEGTYVSIFIMELGSIKMRSSQNTTPLDLRIVVIKGNPGNGGKSEKGSGSKQAILNELKQAGVDMNIYDQIAAYYNIKN